MPLWLYFLSFLFCSVLFLNSNFIYYTSVSCVWFLLLFACNLTERENLQNSDCPFRFLFEDFRLCSRYNNVNYGAWHVYKPLFGCSVATSRLACFETSLSINEKNYRKVSEKVGQSNLADNVTALAQLYGLYSHRARSLNQWQRALYPNVIINSHRARSFNQWEHALHSKFILNGYPADKKMFQNARIAILAIVCAVNCLQSLFALWTNATSNV